MNITQFDDGSMSTVTPEMFQEALDDAKLRLLTKRYNAFLGSLYYNFTIIPDPNTKTIKHSLNDCTISINPEWFVNLGNMDPEYRITAIGEQLYHIAMMHQWRKGIKDNTLFQKASDQVVRNMLDTSGFTLLPYALFNSKYKQASVENVYTEMEQEFNQNNDNNNGDNNSNDPLGSDLDLDNPNNDPNNQSNGNSKPTTYQQNKIQQMLNNAAMAEEMTSGNDMSKHGADFEKVFEDINSGKLSWNIILQNYLNEITRGEISYERFDRRMLPFDMYLPTNESQMNINKIAVAFDVSGSVTEEQIKAFLKEIRAIKDQLSPKNLDVVTFNHEIVDIFKFSEYDPLDSITMNISGGTDLQPVFNYYLKPENKPEFLIIFSDLYCDKIADKPPFECIWICIDNPKAEVNFGKLIHITTEELTNG